MASLSVRHDTFYENRNQTMNVVALGTESLIVVCSSLFFIILMITLSPVDKMDTINFLLTEVSLGLLGNDFFDIHGNSIVSLNLLVSKCSSQNDASTASDVPLLQKLKLSESNFSFEKSKSANAQPYKKPEKLRRLSYSDMSANAMPPADIPAKPKCAKITTRRSTCIGDRLTGGLTTSAAQQPSTTVSRKIAVFKAPGLGVNRSLQPLGILQRDLQIGNFLHISETRMFEI